MQLYVWKWRLGEVLFPIMFVLGASTQSSVETRNFTNMHLYTNRLNKCHTQNLKLQIKIYATAWNLVGYIVLQKV